MKRVALLILITLGSLLLIQACDSPSQTTDEAVLVNETELINTIGFDWYATEKNDYQPEQVAVNDINLAFDPAIHKFVLYITPCQACTGIQDEIPHISKTLAEAGVPESSIEFYFMRKAGDSHPYSDIFTVKRLPNAYLLTTEGGVTSEASILDEARQEGNENIPIEYFVSGAFTM